MGAFWHCGSTWEMSEGRPQDKQKNLRTFPNVPGVGGDHPVEDLSLESRAGPRPSFSLFLSLPRPKRHLISALLVQRYQIFSSYTILSNSTQDGSKMYVQGEEDVGVCVVGKSLTH